LSINERTKKGGKGWDPLLLYIYDKGINIKLLPYQLKKKQKEKETLKCKMR
jgi:hypothetical protein